MKLKNTWFFFIPTHSGVTVHGQEDMYTENLLEAFKHGEEKCSQRKNRGNDQI